MIKYVTLGMIDIIFVCYVLLILSLGFYSRELWLILVFLNFRGVFFVFFLFCFVLLFFCLFFLFCFFVEISGFYI
jgi:hypothetical protein